MFYRHVIVIMRLVGVAQLNDLDDVINSNNIPLSSTSARLEIN